MTRFDLIDEPWIPCLVGRRGDPVDLSLRAALVRAAEVREIYDPSPLVTIALHRLLLAILHRVFGPASKAAWQALWVRGHWDAARVESYLDCWRSRFDLLDVDRPFYQVPRMADAEIHPASRLLLAAASGHNPTLFDHSHDDAPSTLSPALAARHLLATQAYAIGFGKSNPFYFSDAPLVRGFTVLALGNNLFETLALNLLCRDEQRPIPSEPEDCPWWEQNRPAAPDPEGTYPCGYLDLIAEGEPPRVRFCQVQQNLKLARAKETCYDPFKCYRRDEKKGCSPLGLSPERALWRDAHALFQRTDQSYKPPEVLAWLAEINELRLVGKIAAQPSYRLLVGGFATEPGRPASVSLWRQERLPLPLSYLHDEDLVASLDQALMTAEKVDGVLRCGVWRLATLLIAPDPGDEQARRPRQKAIQPVVDSLAVEQRYWPALEGPFRDLLIDLPNDRSTRQDGFVYGERELPRWRETVRRAARRAFAQVTGGLDGSARTLRAVAEAEGRFHWQLDNALAEKSSSGEKGES